MSEASTVISPSYANTTGFGPSGHEQSGVFTATRWNGGLFIDPTDRSLYPTFIPGQRSKRPTLVSVKWDTLSSRVSATAYSWHGGEDDAPGQFVNIPYKDDHSTKSCHLSNSSDKPSMKHSDSESQETFEEDAASNSHSFLRLLNSLVNHNHPHDSRRDQPGSRFEGDLEIFENAQIISYFDPDLRSLILPINPRKVEQVSTPGAAIYQ
jgi:hypothetical protein